MTDESETPEWDGEEHEWPNDDPDEDEEGEETPPLRERVNAGIETVIDALVGTERKKTLWRMTIAVAAVVAVFAALAATAFIGWGLWSGVAFVVALLAGAVTPPALILGLREMVPNIVAIGLAIAAQVAFGQGALVRREDGQYEWTVLREDDEGRYALVDGGRRVPIDGDDGDLFAFGFGDLAVTEEHGDNLDPYTTAEPAGNDDDTPVDDRAGVGVLPPQQTERSSILVSLAKIQRCVRGSASSMLVRRGRDKALDENGGTGQLSQLWTMAFATVLLLVGYAMTIGVLLM